MGGWHLLGLGYLLLIGAATWTALRPPDQVRRTDARRVLAQLLAPLTNALAARRDRPSSRQRRDRDDDR